jgi:hypothetical protein
MVMNNHKYLGYVKITKLNKGVSYSSADGKPKKSMDWR